MKNLFSTPAGMLLLALTGLAHPASAEEKELSYQFEDTRRLVSLVEEAADLMEKDGTGAFTEFGEKNSRWLDDDHYLFVYTLDGTCVFHPMAPELVGRNLMSMRDMDGKPVIQYITQIGQQSGPDAAGWVFYLWEEGTQLMPSWKSSYIRKVIAPDGLIYLVGSGLYTLKMEQAFVQERVDWAVAELKAQGTTAAFDEFRSPASRFSFLGTYIFVMDMTGRALVDPSYPTLVGRSLNAFQDVSGRFIVREMIEKLQKSDRAWVQYLWPRPGESLPSRKLAYVRKAKVGPNWLIVGCDFFMASPIWMKM
ncbi:MAG: cache domain-containing protein [Lentisphaerota bacterium]